MNKKVHNYIRIRKIEFINFRNIENGSIEFPNSNTLDFYQNNPSILGLYGQNGSGKTSVILALGILKDILRGKSLDEKYLSCVRYGCDRCTLKFTFAVYASRIDEKWERFDDEGVANLYDVFYECDIVKRKEEDEIGYTKLSKEILSIENEVFRMRLTDQNGRIVVPKQVFINTKNANCTLFGSKKKDDFYTNHDPKIMQKYRELVAIASARSQSFVFSARTVKFLNKNIGSMFEGNLERIDKRIQIINSDVCLEQKHKQLKQLDNEDTENEDLFFDFYAATILFDLINSLRNYGVLYLHIIDTVTTGITNINTTLPLLLLRYNPEEGYYYHRIDLQMDKSTFVEISDFKMVQKCLDSVSNVLEKIVPGVQLGIKDYGEQLTKDNRQQHGFELISQRGDTIIPLKYESDGIRRIISILCLLIAVYNNPSFTVAIDEIDSGIFEYLLGEILSVMSEEVKGQLIFTSHNLRPLEVLPSKFLCFTTTDPDNRFTTISVRGNSNLRDTYFRSIVLDTQKTPIYNHTDKYEIELAFYKAGHVEVN